MPITITRTEWGADESTTWPDSMDGFTYPKRTKSAIPVRAPPPIVRTTSRFEALVEGSAPLSMPSLTPRQMGSLLEAVDVSAASGPSPEEESPTPSRTPVEEPKPSPDQTAGKTKRKKAVRPALIA